MKSAIINFTVRRYKSLSSAIYFTFPLYFAGNLVNLVHSVIYGLGPGYISWYISACLFGIVYTGWGIPYIFRDALKAEHQNPTSRDFRLYFLYLAAITGLTLFIALVPAMENSYISTSLSATTTACEVVYIVASSIIFISLILTTIDLITSYNPSHP